MLSIVVFETYSAVCYQLGLWTIWDIRPKCILNSNLAQSRLPIPYFVIAQSFWNFAQSTAVTLLIGQPKETFWTNEISLDLSLRWICTVILYCTVHQDCFSFDDGWDNGCSDGWSLSHFHFWLHTELRILPVSELWPAVWYPHLESLTLHDIYSVMKGNPCRMAWPIINSLWPTTPYGDIDLSQH